MRGWVLGLIATIAAALLHLTGALDFLELKLLDLSFRTRGVQQPVAAIALVAVDDESLGGRQRHPLDRAFLAEVVRAVASGRPRIILLDVLLDEPGPSPAADTALEQAIQDAGNVVLPAAWSGGGSGAQVVVPAPRFAQAAMAVGFVLLRESAADGVLRRCVVGGTGADATEASAASFAALAAAALNQPSAGPDELVDSAARWAAEPLGISAPLIDFGGPPGTYHHMPARLLLEDASVGGLLVDRAAIIGGTLSGSEDRFLSPFQDGPEESRLMSGLEVQANCVATLLSERPLRIAGSWASLVVMLCAGALATLLLSRLSAKWGILVVIVAAFGSLALTPLLFVLGRLQWQGAGPAVAVLLVGAVVGGHNYLLAASRVRAIRNAFSRYLAPEVVAEIADSGQMPELGGHVQHATVLFCDMRGFSAISRKLSPPELVAMLSVFLEAMSRPVLQQAGFLDKFVGDQVMAVFGVPYAHADDSVRAAHAALAMRAALLEFNAGASARGWPPVAVSIGIHCGQIVAGNVGWEGRMDYTAMGDTVVLAQRLQTLAREYGTDILISRDVANALCESFVVESLGAAHPRGWDVPVEVHALRGVREAPGAKPSAREE